MKHTQKIRIGTRGSKLALAQTYMVEKALISANPHIKTEIITITTTGDKILDKNLNEIGGKGLFIKEIEEALLSGEIDMAVHSMKDMPAFLHDDFAIPCVLKREDKRDAMLSAKASRIEDLPQGAVVGTSSPRRASQALNLRPDLQIVQFRGNIQTRIEKLKRGEVDATFLAIAGIKRCNITDDVIHIIEEDEMLPAVAQGAIGIEICKKNEYLYDLLAPLNDEQTHIAVRAERAFLAQFEGSCKTPIAASAKISGDKLSLNCLIASMDGTKILRTARQGNIVDSEALGNDAALELLEKAGVGFF